MARKATKKMVGFAEDFVKTGNGTQAALNNYDAKSENIAAAIASENLRKPKVQELIQDFAEIATKNIQELANKAKNEGVKLNANKDMLDRSGHVVITKSMNLNVEVETSPEIKELAKKLNALYGGNDKPSDGTLPGALDNKAQD